MGICRAIFTLPKTCQSCGTEFECGTLCCWCGELKLDAAVRRELKEKFSDCLCRACLEAAAAQAGFVGADLKVGPS